LYTTSKVILSPVFSNTKENFIIDKRKHLLVLAMFN